MIGMAQKEGKLCAWIDAEMSYSEDWAQEAWGKYRRANLLHRLELSMRW
jgi:hypothetical protein